MNLGFYVHNTSNTPLNHKVYTVLNEALDAGLVSDASLFYDEVDFNPIDKKFGTFNSTDLWSFHGLLVVTHLNGLQMANNVVNDIDILYLYTKDDNNLMSLISGTKDAQVITLNEEDSNNFKRLTGRDSILLEEFSAEEIMKVTHERV
tara:strand:+ start:853 stop:1296 length:444 start_codon:yes stop_codon:yes gene_type:complete